MIKNRVSKSKGGFHLFSYSLSSLLPCEWRHNKQKSTLNYSDFPCHLSWQVPSLPCQEPMATAHPTATYKYSISNHWFSIILYPKVNTLFLLICRCPSLYVGPKSSEHYCCTAVQWKTGEENSSPQLLPGSLLHSC